MKQIVNWRLLFVVITMLSCVACSSDDEKIEYTSDEIIDMLEGSWVIGGDLSIISNSSEVANLSDSYKGTITFERGTSRINSYIKITETNTDVDDYHYKPEGMFISQSGFKGCCKILKKEGKPYIQFGSDGSYYLGLFEIVSLSKTSFKMVLDEDYENLSNWEKGCHVHMTLQTQ